MFSASLIVTLIFLYPKNSLTAELKALQKPDRVARQYLISLHHLHPNNMTLKIELAKQRVAAGEEKQAISGLYPYVQKYPKTAQEWQIAYLYFQAIASQTFALKPSDPDRQANTILLREQLNVLQYAPLSARSLLFIANVATATNEKEIAAKIYSDVAKNAKTLSTAELVQAAKYALGVGAYRATADLYFSAQQKATTLAKRREYFLAGVKTLQSGNLMDAAINAALQHFGDLKNDQQTLVALTKVALAANKPDVAQQFIRKVIY